DSELAAHQGAFLHDAPHELDGLIDEGELAERRSGEGRERVEGDVADQLEPELAADLLLDRSFQAAGLEGLGDFGAAVARPTARLADREARPLDVADDSGLDELRRRVGDTADHP